MTDRVVWLDPDRHAAIQQLLPWYVSGRLDEAERAEVEAHLAACPACRSELGFEHDWQAAARASSDDEAPQVDAGWAAMVARIDAPEPLRRGWLARWLGDVPVRAWAVPAMLSLALAAALAFTLLPGLAPPADYRALAAPALDGATAIVRFRPEATEAQIRQVLRQSDARLVDGPTLTDAWIVRLPRERYAATLALLRKQPAVTLAEALEAADER